MKKLIVSLCALFLITPMLLAHAGHKHKTIMGTIQSIDATHIDLKTRFGKKVTVPLAKDTMFMRGEAMAKASEAKPGTRVVIVLGEDDKTAAHVKLGTAKK